VIDKPIHFPGTNDDTHRDFRSQICEIEARVFVDLADLETERQCRVSEGKKRFASPFILLPINETSIPTDRKVQTQARPQSRLTDPRPTARQRSASIYSKRPDGSKSACQRQATQPLALSASERRDLQHFARTRPPHRPSRPKPNQDFHQTEMRLTTLRSGDMAPVRKKVV
jgi:hypothetical protein